MHFTLEKALLAPEFGYEYDWYENHPAREGN